MVKLRQKVNKHSTAMQHQGLDADDDKPMRRVSYLRATANDADFHIDSDFDSSPSVVSAVPEVEPETPEADEVPITKP